MSRRITIADRIRYHLSFGPAERWERLKEKTAMAVAWHLLPARVRMWVIIRAHAACTSNANGHVHPDSVKAFDLYASRRDDGTPEPPAGGASMVETVEEHAAGIAKRWHAIEMAGVPIPLRLLAQ